MPTKEQQYGWKQYRIRIITGKWVSAWYSDFDYFSQPVEILQIQNIRSIYRILSISLFIGLLHFLIGPDYQGIQNISFAVI